MERFSKYVIPFLLVVLLSVFPMLAEKTHYINLMVDIAQSAMVVLGLVVLIGYAGQFSLGQAAFCGTGAYVSGYLTINSGISPLLALLAGIVVSVAVAAIISPILRLTQFYFAVATIAFGTVVTTLAKGLKTWTGGSSGLLNIPNFSVGGFVFDTPTKYFYLYWGLVLVFMWITYNLIDSRMGRALRATRDDETAAKMIGINTWRYKMLAFLISVVFASVSGSLYAHYMRFAEPNMYDLVRSVGYVVLAALGGFQSVWGAIIGAGIGKYLPDAFERFKEYRPLFYGVILVLVMSFMPRGLAGLLLTLYHRVRQLLPVSLPAKESEAQG